MNNTLFTFAALRDLNNMTDEEKNAWNALVEKDEKEKERLNREKAFMACGFGPDYFNCDMEYYKGKYEYNNVVNPARNFYCEVVKHNKSNLLCCGDGVTNGTGKTSLMVSLEKLFTNMVKSTRYGLKQYYICYYTTSKLLCDRLKQAESFNPKESREKILKEILDYDVFAIDEVARFRGLKDEASYLFGVLDLRNSYGKCNILGTNLSRNEFFQHVGAGIVSRLNSNGKLFIADFTGIKDQRVKAYA